MSVPPVVRNNPVLGDTNPAPIPVPKIGEELEPKPVLPDGELPRNEGVKDGEEIPLLKNGVKGEGEIVPAILPGVDRLLPQIGPVEGTANGVGVVVPPIPIPKLPI